MSRLRLFLTGTLILCASCAKTAPLRLQIDPDVKRPDKSVVLFFVDGLDHDRFQSLLDAGKLPNIKRHFVDGGVRVEHAVTSIPSMTYPNTVSLFTGRFPGHHDVTGNQWFDRRTLAYPNYITAAEYSAVNLHFRWPTLYELLPDQFSVNVLGNVARGATYNVDYHVSEGIGWYLGWYSRMDELTAGCIEDIGRLANRIDRWPNIITMYFIGVDQLGHDAGSDSAAYAEGVIGVDRQIGRVLDALRQNGLADSTHTVLVTDHSHTPTHKHRSLDLICWLRDHRGLKIHEGRVFGDDYADRLRELRRYDAVLVDGSYRRIVLHLRGKAGWFVKPGIDEIDAVMQASGTSPRLADLEGVGLVCTTGGPNRIRILSPRGDAVVQRRLEQGVSQYRLDMEAHDGMKPADPLECMADAEMRSFVDSGWHSTREWLAATAKQKYPDFVPQVVEYFDSIRSGELLIFAAEGWSFSGHGRGEHGAALAADMRIPLYFAGPGLPHGGSIPCGRIVDVMPTVIDLLGRPDALTGAPPIDGVSLLPQLRAAGGTAAAQSTP
ncbi:MAG: alkaline phosphatase family protein [Planctomycetes bacterium]|nr:alkaline phosphatase family protein [Planctomycetota bacterium]